MHAIEQAIRNSDLGVNPSNDGNVIRVVIPQLTEERRREYVKLAQHKGEDAKVSVRNIRRKAKDELDKLVKDGEAGEDEVARAEKELDDAHQEARRPDRRPGQAQGSRAARGLSTPDDDRRPADTTEPTDGPPGRPATDGTAGDAPSRRRPPRPAATCRPPSGSGCSSPGWSSARLVVGPRAFLAVVVVAVAYGAWELRRAIATRGIGRPARAAAARRRSVMLVSAYLRGAEALVVTVRR